MLGIAKVNKQYAQPMRLGIFKLDKSHIDLVSKTKSPHFTGLFTQLHQTKLLITASVPATHRMCS
jgi:hypothetical protein